MEHRSATLAAAVVVHQQRTVSSRRTPATRPAAATPQPRPHPRPHLQQPHHGVVPLLRRHRQLGGLNHVVRSHVGCGDGEERASEGAGKEEVDCKGCQHNEGRMNADTWQRPHPSLVVPGGRRASRPCPSRGAKRTARAAVAAGAHHAPFPSSPGLTSYSNPPPVPPAHNIPMPGPQGTNRCATWAVHTRPPARALTDDDAVPVERPADGEVGRQAHHLRVAQRVVGHHQRHAVPGGHSGAGGGGEGQAGRVQGLRAEQQPQGDRATKVESWWLPG